MNCMSLNNENQYGMLLKYGWNDDYPGDIVVDEIRVYKDGGEDYIFTLLYSGGELVTMDFDGIEKVQTSFFNPADEDFLKVSWFDETDRITSSEGIVQYRIDAAKIDQVTQITIFLFDILFRDDGEKKYQLLYESKGC